MFPTMVEPFYIPTSSADRFKFLYILSNTVLFLFFFFSPIVVIVIDVRWHLTVVLICISLMISDVKHIFMCLFSIHISSLEKCLFKFFTHLKIFLNCCWVLEVSLHSGYNCLSNLQIFSPILWTAFSLCA